MACGVAIPECVISGVLSGLSDLPFIFTRAYMIGSPGGTKRAESTRRDPATMVLQCTIPNK